MVRLKILIGLFVTLFLLSGCSFVDRFTFEPYTSGYNPFKHRCLEVSLSGWREESLGTATFHTLEEAEEEVEYLYGDLNRSSYWVEYKPRGNINDWCTKTEREDYSYYTCDFLCYKRIIPEMWTKESLRLARENDKFIIDCMRYEKR